MSLAAHDKATLNDLIATTFDSVDGYVDAGKNSGSDRFVAMFNARAVERLAVITALRSEVMRLGGKAEDKGTLLGGAHRMFLNLKSLVTGVDANAIIDEVEQGEDHLKAKFEYAMVDTQLSPQVMHAIRDCYTAISHGHDQMRQFRHAMDGSQVAQA